MTPSSGRLCMQNVESFSSDIETEGMDIWGSELGEQKVVLSSIALASRRVVTHRGFSASPSSLPMESGASKGPQCPTFATIV